MARAEDASMTHARAAVSLLSAAALMFAGAGQARAATSSSSVQNPTFAFSTPGQKQVTLKACNSKGCSTVTQTITVLDPRPVILSAQVGAAAVEAGQLVNLAGTGRGQPPLTYTWKVTRPSSPEIDVLGAGAWWNTAGVAPGTYDVVLHLQNAAGGVDSQSATVVVGPETAKDFYTVPPCRLLDTRQSSALSSGTPLTFAVAGISAFACGIPATAKAVAVNITVVDPTNSGFVSLYPGNYPVPATSTLNFSPGQTRTNNAVLPLSSDGSGTLAAQPFILSKGSVQLIVDVSGYFL
jgi:PKD repeat protein